MSKPPSRYLFLDGFLGGAKSALSNQCDYLNPSDWSSLDNFSQMKEQTLKYDLVIAYSMGARKLLTSWDEFKDLAKCFAFVGVNPGLQSKEEIDARIKWEMSVTSKLEDIIKESTFDLSKRSFLDYWNELSVFQNDHPLVNVDPSDWYVQLETFERNRLSRQNDLTEHLRNLLDSDSHDIRLFCGENDRKFAGLYSERKLKWRSIPNCGHRAWQSPVFLSFVTSQFKSLQSGAKS